MAIFVLSLLFTNIIAQNPVQEKPMLPLYNFGLGAGLDYGGLGGRFTILPYNEIQLFGSVGYNITGVGFNAGVSFRMDTRRRIYPYWGAMYGYNAALQIRAPEDTYNYVSYGLSLNLGFEYWLRRPGFINFEIVVPFLSEEFQDDYQTIKNNPNILLLTKPRKLLFSIGYHFVIDI